MTWFDRSLMARKGVAGGRPGARSSLTVERRGRFHCVCGPYAAPTPEVARGAILAAETRDAFEGKVKHETDSPSAVLRFPFLNPQDRPDLRERGREGRRAGGADPLDPAARSATGRRNRSAPPA